MCFYLLLVPVDENRVYSHQADPSPHAAGGKQRCFAETNYRNVEGAATLQQARLLEMTDDDGIIPGPFRLQRVSDCLRRTPKFRERMEEMIRGVKALHLEAMTGGRYQIELTLQALDIGGLLHRMDEALIPKPCGSRVSGHGVLRPIGAGI